MLGSTEIKNAMEGNFLLAKRDLTGLNYFDKSIDGFWRSFEVIFLIAPFYFLYSLQEFQIGQEIFPREIATALNLNFFISKSLLLVIDWLVFPITMIFVCRLLALWPKYMAFITVYNWTSLFVILALCPVAFLYITGVLSAHTAATFNMISVGFVLYYRWYVARNVLETSATTTSLIIAFDLVLSMLVHGLFYKIAA